MGYIFKPIAFKDIKITRVHPSRIIIHSQDLLRELRGVTRYYPAQSLTGSSVELWEPYNALVHHLDELYVLQSALKQRFDTLYPLANAKKLTNCSKDAAATREQLSTLLRFVGNSTGHRMSLVNERLSRPAPVVTFDDLWALFRPGSDVLIPGYIRDVPCGSVVQRTKYLTPTKSDRREGKKDQFLVSTWSLEYNGVRVSRDKAEKAIDRYDGELEVASLPIFPLIFNDKKDEGKARRALEERGRRLYEVIRAQPKQMWYDGLVHNANKQSYRRTAIIDTNTAIANKDFLGDKETDYGFFASEITFQSSESDMVGQSLETFPWASYHDISVKDTTELPTKHHCFLLAPIVPGFALHDKTWKLSNIEALTEAKFQVDMENLKIDQGKRDIVQAICHAHSRPWKIDYVSSKGEGQVALLHGPPGVGKTYTVECISQATGRPLIALTIGDLMVEEDQIETKLLNWFSLAERWKAILLLDEADTFLERRATRDIQRNGIVSIFLRRMEYFRGLLFLTTNRVGQIDDAFLSKVAVVLQYDHLTDDTRKKIWTGFFKKLQKDSEQLPHNRKVEVDKYAQKYVLNDPEVKDLRWNGREIRNALQTAISLASYKAVKDGQTTDIIEIEEEHFKTVVEMSRKFKGYMKSITGKEEGERAKARLERNDPYQSTLT